jgi:hypothetical protein
MLRIVDKNIFFVDKGKPRLSVTRNPSLLYYPKRG